jgi:glucosyl-dolichyl phosphate glucuronosyltransferase
MAPAQITAAICTHCRRELLSGTLASVARQNLALKLFNIVVVDNSPQSALSGCAPDTYSSIPNLRWIQASSVGLSGARNLAVAACETPLIAFLDDDALASENWLSTITSVFDDCGENVFAIGGRVDPLWQAPRPVWLPDELLGHLSLVNWGDERRTLRTREWIAGTNMAFRVSQLNRIGGFSGKFGRYGGDEMLLSNDENDVISRLKQEGGEVMYVPEASVQHLVSVERLTQSWFRRRVVWQAISDYMQRPQEFFAKAGAHWNTIQRFNAGLNIEYQIPHGLYIEQSDPDIFARQMSTLYSYTIVMLTGFRGISG